MRIATLVLLVSFIVPAWASEPGQPLDCSDWVILEPGITCRVLVGDCGKESSTGNPDFPCANVGGSGVTASGDLIGVEYLETGEPFCGFHFGPPSLELNSFDGMNERVLGSVEWRCVEYVSRCRDRIAVQARGFDSTNGRLLVWFRSWNTDCPEAALYDKNWLAAFEGFATTFEVMQTYTPPSGPLSYRVPYMPEGFQYADYFDTYYGELATVGDWPQAQPLQCGYPATAPSVGDYLTVDDPLPPPASGQGYYFVTAVTHQGQRRYGRQSDGGVLTGRDPAVLPMCE